jgi:hypothetical protein
MEIIGCFGVNIYYGSVWLRLKVNACYWSQLLLLKVDLDRGSLMPSSIFKEWTLLFSIFSLKLDCHPVPIILCYDSTIPIKSPVH